MENVHTSETIQDNNSKSHELHAEINGLIHRIYDLTYYDNSWAGTQMKDECISQIQQLIVDLYNQCVTDKYLWQFCPFSVYESHFETIQKEFFNNNPDAEQIDFLRNELKKLGYPSDLIPNVQVHYIQDFYIWESNYFKLGFLSDECILRYTTTQKKKYSFLNEKLTPLIPAKIESNPVEPIQVSNDEAQQESEIESEYFIDYSNDSDPDKYVMLHELGIIDYLKSKVPKEISEQRLGALISTFTGISAKNVRSYINGSKNKTKNNKLTDKNIEKAHAKLKILQLNASMFKQKTLNSIK